MVPSTPLDVINVQVKRLRGLFKINLTTAKRVLACGPYGCRDWVDLCSRLDQETPLQDALQLANVHQSPVTAAYLAKNLRPFAASVSQLIITNRNLPELCEALRQVFAIPGEPVSLADVLQPITLGEWLPTDLGPDPLAVIQNRVCVNGAELQLLGTRIFWPRLFAFDADIKIDPLQAEPYGDDLKIMWEVAPWYRAARDYLLEYQRGNDWDDLPDFVEPRIPECARMQHHAQWLASCLEWSNERRYSSGEGEEFIPFLYQGQAYLVFGVPCPSTVSQTPLRRQYVQIPGEETNRYQVIQANGQLLQIEMLEVPKPSLYRDWDFAEYHGHLLDGLFGAAESAGWISPPLEGWGNLLFLSPASHFALEHQLEVEITPEPNQTLLAFQTDNPELAILVLERLHKGDFTRYEHDKFPATYGMRIEFPSGHEPVDVSLSMSRVDQSGWGHSNLISVRVTQREHDKQILLCSIDPALLKLVERQPMKVLKEAIREGRILRVQGWFGRLQAAPTLQPGGRASGTTTCNASSIWDESDSDDVEVSIHVTRYHRHNL